MPSLNFRRYYYLIRRIYREHFSIGLFSISAFILGVGIFILPISTVMGGITAVLLLLITTWYYVTYLSQYKLLSDIYSHSSQYHFNAFSVFNIIIFNALFLFVFAYIGVVLDKYFPLLGFAGASFYDLLLFLIQSVVDGLTFGLLENFGANLSGIKFESTFARTYVYLTKLTIDLAIIASVVSVVRESIHAKRELQKVVDGKEFDSNFFASLTPVKVRETLRCIRRKDIVVSQKQNELLSILGGSKSKEAKDIILQILQSTENMDVFSSCVDYFCLHQDRRFKFVCKRIRKPEKRKILEGKGIELNRKHKGTAKLEETV